MKKRRSFKVRLALLAAVISGVILLAFALVAWVSLKRQFLVSLDSRIALPALQAFKGLRPEAGGDFLEIWDSAWIGSLENVGRGVVVRRRGQDEPLHVSAGAEWLAALDLSAYLPKDGDPGPPPRRPPERRADREVEGDGGPDGRGRRRPQPPGRGGPERPPELGGFFTVEDPQGDGWRMAWVTNPVESVVTGVKLADFANELRPARTLFLITVPVSLAAIILGGLYVSARALRPLARITATAEMIDASGLDQRIPITGNEYAEFGRLVDVLNAMVARLERSFTQATRFTADASHELKTPIAILQAEVDAALKNPGLAASSEDAFLGISGEVQRLKRITQSLLLLSQADAGELRLTREKLDLSDETRSICEDAEVLCAGENLEFNHEIERGITVDADPVLLRQAVQNLLTNAIKYSDVGGAVTCRLHRDGDHALLLLSNTGPGIPKENRGQIFDRFFRADRARNRKKDGFGLGLNLAQEIVRAHGGDLSLNPEVGLTTFVLRLPVAG